MKKNLLFLAFALCSLTASAQQAMPATEAQQQQVAAPAANIQLLFGIT
jgi:outer membrane protein